MSVLYPQYIVLICWSLCHLTEEKQLQHMKITLTSLREQAQCMHVDIQGIDKMHISKYEIMLDTLK